MFTFLYIGLLSTCSGNSSCPGKEVNYICTVTSAALLLHVDPNDDPNDDSDSVAFTVSQLLSDGINSKGDFETKDNFTVTFTDDSNGDITAEIKFIAKESLDKSVISCVDGGSGKEENCTIHIASKI